MRKILFSFLSVYSRPRKSPSYQSGSMGEPADGNWIADGRRGSLDLET
jgi:hypothetical protein